MTSCLLNRGKIPHSRVTPLAEERKRRTTRRAADAQRSASAAGLISLDSARALCISLRTSHLTKEVEAMDIKRIGSQPSTKGPTDWFTGTVRIDPLYDTPEPSRVSCASVTFEPGSLTAWHTHPLGQTLIVTMGCGWVQEWGGPIEEIHPGDVIRCPPGKKHWHGATPTTAMTHIAIQEKLDGKA